MSVNHLDARTLSLVLNYISITSAQTIVDYPDSNVDLMNLLELLLVSRIGETTI
jgi:DNA uptake protein ComE-like DNA-binding protein